MIRSVLEFLINDPGGWPRGMSFDPAAAARRQASHAEARVRFGSATNAALLFAFVLVIFLAFPFSYGVAFASRFHSLWFIALIFACLAPVMRRMVLGRVPANRACRWPKNERDDRRRQYQDLVIKVTLIWLMSLAVFLQTVMTMRYGLGDDWNPFTRATRITKGGSYAEYGFIQIVMFISGFFAITGFIWWPMYLFFEWLEMRRDVGKGKEGLHA